MKWGILLLLSMVGFLSCERRPPLTQTAPAPEIELADLSEEAWKRADSILHTFTLRQKVAQMFMPALYATGDYWTIRQAREYADSCIGGLILLKGDVSGARVIADTVSHLVKIAPFVAIDAEWGLAMRLVDAPEFPDNSSISESVDDQLMYDYGTELARECRILGINMVLGPVVDVSTPDSYMKRRSFGGNPARVADMAVAYARGLEDGCVISVAKHFPGHGSVTVDSHKKKGIIARSLNQMDSTDIYPFRQWIQNDLSGIMVGHLAVPSVDPEMLPAAVSKAVIGDLLRDDLGFKGLVLTDALNMKGAEGYGAADAIKAGADIVLAPLNTFGEIDSVIEKIQEGYISVGEIDTHVRRILFYKCLFEPGINKKVGKMGQKLSNPITDTISKRLIRKK